MSYRNEFNEIQGAVYWSLPRILFFVFLLVIVLYGLGFLATGGDLAIYQFWAPKRANAERKVFENTQSYVQGKTEYISRLRFQYQTAEGPQKQALRSLILTEAATVDNNKLPMDLQSFIDNLKERQ